MAESDMRSRVTSVLRPLHAVAVENPVRPGTPDVNYVEGWLELKWARNWPKRVDSPLVLDHWTPEQRIFFIERVNAGGKIHLLLQVQTQWFLLPPMWAVQHLGKATRQQIIEAAEKSWLKGLVATDLLAHLRGSITKS